MMAVILFARILFVGFIVTKSVLSKENVSDTISVNAMPSSRNSINTIECDCGDGECEFVDGIKKCTCRNNLIEVNGKCQECDCGENSISCQLSAMKYRLCTCKDGYASSKFLSVTHEKCKKCDCGDGECKFVDGIKNCTCRNNLIEVNGQCQECDCGAKGISCTFDNDLMRENQTCTCKYDDVIRTEKPGEKCKECDCGENSISCELSLLKTKRCTCKAGYASSYTFLDTSSQKCRKCDCGTNGILCSFLYISIMNQKQICTCKYGDINKTEDEGKKCKECDCGPNSDRCSFNSMGYKKCECLEDYRSETVDDSPGGGEYCKRIEADEEGIPGWMIAIYVLTVLVAIIVIALLVAFIYKSMNRRATLSGAQIR